MSAEPLFKLDRVTLGKETARRDGRRLREISVEIPTGTTAVLGWSGAGKTSLLNLLAGFEKPTSGTVRGDTRVAWVPQNDGLWHHCTAREHLTECGASRAEAERLLAAFDLEAYFEQKPMWLSRGEQSRLALARALAMPARTLVMDEPLAHVDPARAGKYWGVIREHVARTGVSLIFSTHNPETALAEANHALGLRGGAMTYAGAMRELYDAPANEELATLLGPTNWLEPDEARAWLGVDWARAGSVRPERVGLAPAPEGSTVVSSRFRGSHAETELCPPTGTARVFRHRPSAALAAGTRVQVMLLALLVCLCCAGCRSDSDPAAIPVKEWHTWMLPPEGPTQPTPRSLAVGPREELAVLDTAGRVLIYDSEGKLLRRWKMLDVQFGKPEGIVWIQGERLVVCDTHYHRLVWFDHDGKVLRTVGQSGTGPAEFVFPVGITKDSAENLYVCEYGGHDRVQVFTREGVWLREIGSAGTGPGQFQRPSGMAWREGKLYVADAVNHRVLIFKDTGEYLGLLGATGGGASALTFNLPYDITLAKDGAFYVIEYGAGRMTKVSPDGLLLGRYGTAGSGEGQFATPWGIISDGRMRIYVADTQNRRLVRMQL